MKRLVSEIQIGNFVFDYVTEVSIQSSWDMFTDTAQITMPNKFRRKDGQPVTIGTDNVFQRGDEVTIKIGYSPELVTRFKGFISAVKPDSPFVLECEDKMWEFKQENLVSKEFNNTTIKEVVEYATASQPDLVIEFDDETAKIGGFHIDNKGFVNAVTVFEVLKKTFGYNIYFVDEVLQVRVLKSFLTLSNPVHKIGFETNIISNTLDHQRDDDQDMMVRFESKQTDNTVLTFFGFKKDGEPVVSTTGIRAGVTHSWRVPELTEATIKRIILDNLDKYVWEGFTGGFTTFLQPTINHSDCIDLSDKEHPERDGRYLIQGVEIVFGINGGRQTVELRNRVL